jgi:GNAT superfamily N-acetyltransferase
MIFFESTDEEKESLDDKLVAFNKSKVPYQQSEDWISLSYVLKDETGQVTAGIVAALHAWKVMYVDILYVEADYRGKGYGTLLLEKAESEAKSLGGYLSYLDTLDFQAKEFYQKMGYSVFGVLEDCPRGHNFYYMQKRL